jgi:hypothetical protein
MAFFVILGVMAAVFALLMRAVMSPGARRTGGPGPGASGAVYDMLNEDKRKAIEIILEERAGYRDPEHADDKPSAGSNTPVTPTPSGTGRRRE